MFHIEPRWRWLPNASDSPSRESDYDGAVEEVRRYNVLNLPAVAIEGESVVIEAFGADELIERLQRFVN